MKSPFSLTGSLSVSLYDGVGSAVIAEKLATQAVYYRAVVPGWDNLSEGQKYSVALAMHKAEVSRLKSVAEQLKQGYRYR